MSEWQTQDFQTEEEIAEALDAIVEAVGERILEEDGKTSILDPQRMEQMKFCYSVLRFLTVGKDVTLSYKLHEPFQSMGSISVEGDHIEFTGGKWLSRMAEFANNMDIYPLSKKAVRITFTFHGLTKPME